MADDIEAYVQLVYDTADERAKSAKAALPDIMDACSDAFVNAIRSFTPIREGALFESIDELGRESTEEKSTVAIGTALYYAPWVERGTLLHRIQPTLARRLEAQAQGKRVAIYWPTALRPVAASEHGAIERPFMKFGKAAASQELPRIAGDIMKAALGL